MCLHHSAHAQQKSEAEWSVCLYLVCFTETGVTSVKLLITYIHSRGEEEVSRWPLIASPFARLPSVASMLAMCRTSPLHGSSRA